MINQHISTFCVMFMTVSLVSISSCLLLSSKMRALRRTIRPRVARLLPLSIAERMRHAPVHTFTDHNGSQIAVKENTGDCFVLALSLYCPVCRELLLFLATHQNELSGNAPFFLVAPRDIERLRKMLAPARYAFLGEIETNQLFKASVIPSLFHVQGNKIVSKYLVNAGEDLLSVVNPLLWQA
jgi:hypothetical protein